MTYLIEPVLDALIILAAIKLLEEKKFRDYMQIYTICTFLLLGSSFISLSIVFLIYFLFLIFLLTISLILLAYYSRDPDMLVSQKSMLKIVFSSILICLLSIPATVFFFLILPRTNYPLLTFLNQFSYARTGFSDDVTLGSVSAIQEDNNVIFRAEMNRVNENSLYWRGIVLERFDGKSWKSGQETVEAGIKRTMEGTRIHQVIYLEPYGNKYLFGLDKPLQIALEKRILEFRIKVRNTGDLTYSLEDEIEKRVKYDATSVLSEFLPDRMVNEKPYLQIPENFSLKIRELAEQLSRGKSEDETIDTFYRFLKFGDYHYTMKNLPVSENPLETFLFEHRKGNCEYFASSLAVMLRIAGIPSRLVGGYKGGYYNDAGKYYMVLQKNAHVWVEVYGNGGWRRLDPTTPYMADASGEGYRETLLFKVKLMVDTLNYYWNKLVINYDFSKQLAVARKIHQTLRKPHLSLDINKSEIVNYLTWALGLLIFFCAVYLIFAKRRSRTDRLISGFITKMARYGYEKRDSEGLEEFLSKIDKEDLRDRAHRFVADFESLYYRDAPFTKEDVKRLEKRIREI